jgi:hypothetical protein
MPSRNSFINANQMTAKQIADLLLRLSADEAEYNKYFEYRKKPLSEEFFEVTQRSYCHPMVLCRLCDYAAAHQAKMSNPDTSLVRGTGTGRGGKRMLRLANQTIQR